MLELTDVISEAEKRKALERALTSRTLSRSSQLRSLLRYICEAEIEGRADDLKEYALGVSALGRAPNYSPSADSCVRTRAYELRNKLRILYEMEAREAPVRIEIRKGGYAPRFVRLATSTPVPVREPVTAPPGPESPIGPVVTSSRNLLYPLAMGVMGALLLFLTYVVLHPKGYAEAADADLSTFWSPFLDSRVPLILSYETRPVGKATGNQSGETEQIPEFAEARDFADAGSIHAVFLLTQMFAGRQRPIALKRAGSLAWDDIWSSNVIFIGRPNLRPGMKYDLGTGDFAEAGDRIRNLRPGPGEAAEYLTNGTRGAGEKYAIITREPGPQTGHSILILEGAGSEYGWALAEYITNPADVRELLSRLRASSGGKLPEAFQMLIRATFDSNVPVRIQYVTHHILNDGRRHS